MKVARQLSRNSIGIEIKKSLIPIIKKKLGFEGQLNFENNDDIFEIIIREGVKKLRIDFSQIILSENAMKMLLTMTGEIGVGKYLKTTLRRVAYDMFRAGAKPAPAISPPE